MIDEQDQIRNYSEIGLSEDCNLRSETRAIFEGENLYPTATICGKAEKNSSEYTQRLLFDKLDTIRRHNTGGLVVDLCCATGSHIQEVCRGEQPAIGIDFSLPYLQQALKKNSHALYIAADAGKLPLASNSVNLIYSLSALYVISNTDEVIAEVARVLKPGGRCVLDLGNSLSLNSYCVRNHYPELPTNYHLSIQDMILLFRQNGLSILEHRAFQLLPLWAGRPRWLWPLLHPFWKRFFCIRLGNLMIDEWLCSVPLLRRFAFRHLLVCIKC